MALDIHTLIPHAFNAILLTVIGFLIRNKLGDICQRITRIENTFFDRRSHDEKH